MHRKNESGDFTWDELDVLLGDRNQRAPYSAQQQQQLLQAQMIEQQQQQHQQMLQHQQHQQSQQPISQPDMMLGINQDPAMMHHLMNNGHAWPGMPTNPGVPPPQLVAGTPPNQYPMYGNVSRGNQNPPPLSFTGPEVVTSGAEAQPGTKDKTRSRLNSSVTGTSAKKLNRGGPGSASATASVDKSEEEVEDRESKRRAAVAAASRATRAKRKRELEELKEKNVRLEKEREAFLNTIADLQMKVQALRETGSIDLRMENDLLRAELMEHKSFISRFKRIADGMPTRSSAKSLMCKQGSDTAVAQVLGLLSTSMADPSWKIGHVPGNPQMELRYQRLPHGVLAENAKRCSVRIDIPVIPCPDPLLLAKVIWKTWSDEGFNKRIGKHFGVMNVSVREIDTQVDQTAEKSQSAAASQAKKTEPESDSFKNQIKLFYYCEETPGDVPASERGANTSPNDLVDTVLLLSSREKNISRSSFPLDGRFHKFPPSQVEEKLKAQASSAETMQDASPQKNVEAVVLASTSTQHSLGLVPVKPGIHRIHSALLEGSVFRKVEGGVAMTTILSFPSAMTEAKGKHKHDVLVTNEGFLNQVWTNVIQEVQIILREHYPPTVFEEYRKLHARGGPVPEYMINSL